MIQELLQYNWRYDLREKDKTFISTQLVTHVRERFNVLISTVNYDINNDHLVRRGAEEPFIESIKKGKEVIQALKPIPIDFAREEAEVIGFRKIDEFLSDPSRPINSKMLSISPKGEEDSKYQHNFYDIFTLREKNGKRYVELRRYSSGLSKQDYVSRLHLNYQNPKAEDFLSNPIKAPQSLTPEEIHKLLHIQHDYMDPSEFERRILNSSYVRFYMNRYVEHPEAKAFKAILNAADEVLQDNSFRDYSTYTPSYADIRYLEKKEVRQAGGQCPGKSGADADDSPYSVSEFTDLSPDKYGERTFECPECGKTNVRPKEKLLKNCQHCGSSKVGC